MNLEFPAHLRGIIRTPAVLPPACLLPSSPAASSATQPVDLEGSRASPFFSLVSECVYVALTQKKTHTVEIYVCPTEEDFLM